MYQDGTLTIGLLSKLIGSSPIDIYEALISDSDMRVIAMSGKTQDSELSINSLSKAKKISLDLTSILTLHHINLHETVTKLFDEIHIAQSTVDLLNQVYIERSAHKETGMLKTWGENGKLRGISISKEIIQQNLDFLSKIMKWISEHCKIGIIPLTLHLERTEKEKLSDTLGGSFVDSILISKYPDITFVSDDLILRQIALNDFEIQSGCVKDLIDYTLKKQIIGLDLYKEKIVQLISLNFSFIPIGSEILLEAFKKDNYSFGTTLNKCLRFLGKEADYKSVIIVCSTFIISIWRFPLTPGHRNLLLSSFLDQVTLERDKANFAKLLRGALYQQLRYSPIEYSRIEKFIDLWLNSKLIIDH